jgi:hypothetical protein
MAKASNQIVNFRSKINNLLTAFEQAQGICQTIDYLGGLAFYKSELEKTDSETNLVYEITPAQFTAAINAITSIKTLLDADNQVIGKALARMRD